MRCLVTGANGFAASHLIDHLKQLEYEVTGTVRIRSKMDNIAHSCIDLVHMDMHDAYGVDHVIQKVKPDFVFHLAAQSFVGWSWNHPDETLKTNVNGTLYLLEAVRRHVPNARVHIASSSQIYGKMCPDGGMGADTLFSPMNPYDTSKLAQDMLALQYHNSYGLKIIRTRAFNISGPRRGESFAESSWAKQIAEIELSGNSGVIKHGNLESYRDYVDVRDVARAYARACFHGDAGEVYILGSGEPKKMGDVLDELIRASTADVKKEVDPNRMRPSDTPYMKAKGSVLSEWAGGLTPFYLTMGDLLDYWREKVRGR